MILDDEIMEEFFEQLEEDDRPHHMANFFLRRLDSQTLKSGITWEEGLELGKKIGLSSKDVYNFAASLLVPLWKLEPLFVNYRHLNLTNKKLSKWFEVPIEVINYQINKLI